MCCGILLWKLWNNMSMANFSWFLMADLQAHSPCTCSMFSAHRAECRGAGNGKGSMALPWIYFWEEWRMTSFPEKDSSLMSTMDFKCWLSALSDSMFFFDLSWLEEMCPTMFLQTSLSLMCSLCILGCQGPCYQQGRPAVYMFGCQAALIAAKTMKTTGEMKLCSLWGCPTLWCATSFLDMIANFLRIEFDMFD